VLEKLGRFVDKFSHPLTIAIDHKMETRANFIVDFIVTLALDVCLTLEQFSCHIIRSQVMYLTFNLMKK